MAPIDSSTSGGKAYIVTGPTSGFGRQTAIELARHGTVVLVGRDSSRCLLRRKGRPMKGSALVRDPEFSERVVAETRALLARVPA